MELLWHAKMGLVVRGGVEVFWGIYGGLEEYVARDMGVRCRTRWCNDSVSSGWKSRCQDTPETRKAFSSQCFFGVVM